MTEQSLTFSQFHNALRILLSIDLNELEEVGLSLETNPDLWRSFIKDPFLWFIKANQTDAQKVWQLVEKRQRRWVGTSNP